jgi:hypothetical protein
METGTCNASEVAGSELESAGCLCARAESSLLFPPATWTSQELSFVETLPDLGMSERTHQFFPIKIAFSLGFRASSPHQNCHLWEISISTPWTPWTPTWRPRFLLCGVESALSLTPLGLQLSKLPQPLRTVPRRKWGGHHVGVVAQGL